MPNVITNKNTSQDPIVSGLTGTQSIKFIDAQRVYIKTADSTSTAPVGTYFSGYSSKSNGSTPAGWTDLGIITGRPKINYTKKVKDITTGMDNVVRSVYVQEKRASLDFSLSQFDDVTLQNISGLSPSVLTAGSALSFNVGSEDLVVAALLLVAQNKIDGKEIQFYNPASYLVFEYSDNGDELVLKVQATLQYFSLAPGSKSMYIYQTQYA